jgi:hypothetical protein
MSGSMSARAPMSAPAESSYSQGLDLAAARRGYERSTSAPVMTPNDGAEYQVRSRGG